jgi:hypothetical protein
VVILGGLCKAEVDVVDLMEELMMRLVVILGELCEAEVDVVDLMWLFLINRFGQMHWQSKIKQVIKLLYILDSFC